MKKTLTSSLTGVLFVMATIFLSVTNAYTQESAAEKTATPPPKNNGELVKSGPVYEGQKKLLSAFVKAFTEGDAEGCAKLYTEDTVYMQAGLPIEIGRNIVLDGYQKYFSSRTNKIIEMEEPIKEVISFGNMAVIRGTGKNIEETPSGVRITKTYKYMILSEKQNDGSWQMKWDIYNYDDNYK